MLEETAKMGRSRESSCEGPEVVVVVQGRMWRTARWMACSTIAHKEDSRSTLLYRRRGIEPKERAIGGGKQMAMEVCCCVLAKFTTHVDPIYRRKADAAASVPKIQRQSTPSLRTLRSYLLTRPTLQRNDLEMDASKVVTLLEQLDDEIDDLEESLAPLVATALSNTASKLPLLDQAKLYVLVTYAIESVLFCEFRTWKSVDIPNNLSSLSAA
jgi:hypothetical protein